MRNSVHRTQVETLEPRSLLSAGQPVNGEEPGVVAGAVVAPVAVTAAEVGAQLQQIRQNLEQVQQSLGRIRDAVVRMRQISPAAVFSAVNVGADAEGPRPTAAVAAPRPEDFDAVGHASPPRAAEDRLRSYAVFNSR